MRRSTLVVVRLTGQRASAEERGGARERTDKASSEWQQQRQRKHSSRYSMTSESRGSASQQTSARLPTVPSLWSDCADDDAADDRRRQLRAECSSSLAGIVSAVVPSEVAALVQMSLRQLALASPPKLLLLLGVCLVAVGADLADLGSEPPPLPQLPSFLVNESYIGWRCPKYTCDGSTEDEYHECSCHPSCSLFGTCCADVRPPDWRRLALPADQYECAPPVPWSTIIYDFQPNHSFYTHNMGVMMVNKCPDGGGSGSSSSSSYLRALCAHPLQQTGDGVLSTPVTAILSEVAYRNVFCAFCHGVNVSAVVEWSQVNITIPENFGYSALGGNVRIGFRIPDGLYGCECRRNLATGCSGSEADTYRDACENEPTAYVYDNWNDHTFRNWNCSACNGRPSVTCVFSRFTFDYWWPDTPVDVPVTGSTDEVGELCPRHLNANLSVAERKFWLDRCPSLETATADQPFCSAWLDTSDLTGLYLKSGAATSGTQFVDNRTVTKVITYGIASGYAWVSLTDSEECLAGNGGTCLAPAFCAKCTSWLRAVPCVTPSESGDTLNDKRDANATLTINGREYRKPFFIQRSAECYVIVCGQWDLLAVAATSASTCHCDGSKSLLSVASIIALAATTLNLKR